METIYKFSQLAELTYQSIYLSLYQNSLVPWIFGNKADTLNIPQLIDILEHYDGQQNRMV